MKIGDLVIVKQDIDEYVDIHGKVPGIITAIISPETSPQLVEVFWTSGESEFENFYADEIELINESR